MNRRCRLLAIQPFNVPKMCAQCDENATDYLMIQDRITLAFCPRHANEELEKAIEHFAALQAHETPAP